MNGAGFPACPACGHHTSAFAGSCTAYVLTPESSEYFGRCGHACDGEPGVWDVIAYLGLAEEHWTFRQWLIRTHRGAAGWRGELAAGAEGDPGFPHGHWPAILAYCLAAGASEHALMCLHVLWREYDAWRAALPAAAGTPVPDRPRPLSFPHGWNWL